jgi:ODP family beta-lactamase
MATTSEIAPNVYRISIYAPWGDLQFNHFLIKDEEPVLFHTGLKGMFAEVQKAVSKLIRLTDLRHISFSHFESDECGSLNDWLTLAPQADVLCSRLGALVSLNDFIGREARPLADGEVFSTGEYRFRYCQTPHLPHGWDAGVLFEESSTLCYVLTYSIKPAMLSQSPSRTSSAGRNTRCAITRPGFSLSMCPTPALLHRTCTNSLSSSRRLLPSCMAQVSRVTAREPWPNLIRYSSKSSEDRTCGARTPDRSGNSPVKPRRDGHFCFSEAGDWGEVPSLCGWASSATTTCALGAAA